MRPFDQDAEERAQEEQEAEARMKEGDEEGEQEEAQIAKAARTPATPSKEEVSEHMITHLPYRSWCAHCVKGKAKSKAHRMRIEDRRNKTVPTVTLDYTFMGESQRDTEEKGMPIMVVKDVHTGYCGTGMVFARVVPRKGPHPYAVKRLANDIGLLGHSELVLKSDGEPAIVALKEAAKRERHERIVLEEPPVHESQSNGAAENAILQVQGQFRVIKDALESRIGVRITGEATCVPWMVSHAAALINRYHVGLDGKTNYQRWKGKRFAREVAEFGEQVLYLRAGSRGIDKFNTRWEDGVWLGVRDETGEIIIGTDQGVIKARDFKRRGSDQERWSAEAVLGIKGVPWEPVPGRAQDEVPVRVYLPQESEPPQPVDLGSERPEVRRRVYIRREDVIKYGFTIGCPGCQAVSRNAPSQNHTEACRARIEKHMRDEGQDRIKVADARINAHRARKRQQEEAKPEESQQEQAPEENKHEQEPEQQRRKHRRKNKKKRERDADASDEEEEERAQKYRQLDEGEDADNIDQVDSYSRRIERDTYRGTLAQVYYDDMSGKELPEEGVRKARQEELGELKKHGVYRKVPLKECWEATGKEPIGTRWVDVNKGDEEKPDYRSRLVAQEIKRDRREDLFAATPPLEAKKLLFSLAVTQGVGHKTGDRRRGHKLDFIDVRRAYFHARARRRVYVRLPPEDDEPGMCAVLEKALYGTRDAAQNWEFEYVDFLVSEGFNKGRATPCMFLHAQRDIRVVVHGDDFTILGAAQQLDWFRQRISERFEVKFRGRLGPEDHDEKSIRILNRVVQWVSDGINYEADQRHAEIIVRDLGYTGNTNSVITPCTAHTKDEDETPLTPEDALQYRALVARANYLAQDRGDIGFAVKELCRHMSAPRVCDWARLKRFGRYLVGRTRVVVKYKYQDYADDLTLWTDSDHAGCLRTRKSTSGGVIMLGEHLIKTWSVTQPVIALSSGEAEYYGMVRGASNAFGVQGMLKDFGLEVGVNLLTDSSAAKGIGNRRGLGKVRHIELSELWLQEKVAEERLNLYKIPGEDNISDHLTKAANRERIELHLRLTSQVITSGRHALMPQV